MISSTRKEIAAVALSVCESTLKNHKDGADAKEIIETLTNLLGILKRFGFPSVDASSLVWLARAALINDDVEGFQRRMAKVITCFKKEA